MLIASGFPPTTAEWSFLVVFAVVLVAPLVAEKLRLPGLVGLVLGGLLVGPTVLDWVPRDGLVEELGQLGLLYLMFLAGLELDLDRFNRSRRSALLFGAFTFTFPFALGLIVAPSFGYMGAAAILFGSLWASHTLVSYPIVQERGITRDPAVGIAAGGTVITDTAALFVLAVVAGSTTSDEGTARLVIELTLGVIGLAVYALLVLPRIARWAFSILGQQRGARFLVLLVGFLSSAVLADAVGIEGIVGAFFAGLGLNRLVPARSILMERVEFVGGTLLIPFFLISTGMLVDPAAFTDPRVLALAGASLAAVLIGKAAAAYLIGRIQGYSRNEKTLVFGLTIAQAAATLATVTIGVDIGLFDDDILNATLVVVLVTVVVASVMTARAASRIDPPPIDPGRLFETIAVTSDPEHGPALGRLAGRIASAHGGSVLAVAVAPPDATGDALADARARASRVEAAAASVGAEVETVVRQGNAPAEIFAGLVGERQATLFLASVTQVMTIAQRFFGQDPGLVGIGDVPVLAVAPGDTTPQRLVLSVEATDLAPRHAAELELAVSVAEGLAGAFDGRCLVIAPTDEDARRLAARISAKTEAVVNVDHRVTALEAMAGPEDLVIIPLRRSMIGMRSAQRLREGSWSICVAARRQAASPLVADSPIGVAGRASV